MTGRTTDQGAQDAFAIMKGFFDSADFDARVASTDIFNAAFDAADAIRACALSSDASTLGVSALRSASSRFLRVVELLNGARRAQTRRFLRLIIYLYPAVAPVFFHEWRLIFVVVPCAIIDSVCFGDSFFFRALTRVATSCWNLVSGK